MPVSQDAVLPITYFSARAERYASDRTLRRRVAAGRLPKRKLDGKYHWTPAEVRTALQPQASPIDSDSGLQAWAEARAAEAPPLRPEQVRTVVEAFSRSLSELSGASPA